MFRVFPTFRHLTVLWLIALNKHMDSIIPQGRRCWVKRYVHFCAWEILTNCPSVRQMIYMPAPHEYVHFPNPNQHFKFFPIQVSKKTKQQNLFHFKLHFRDWKWEWARFHIYLTLNEHWAPAVDAGVSSEQTEASAPLNLRSKFTGRLYFSCPLPLFLLICSPEIFWTFFVISVANIFSHVACLFLFNMYTIINIFNIFCLMQVFNFYEVIVIIFFFMLLCFISDFKMKYKWDIP